MDSGASAIHYRKPALTPPMFQTTGWSRARLIVVVVFLFALILMIPELRAVLWSVAGGIQRGFLAVYVDAASFVSGCF